MLERKVGEISNGLISAQSFKLKPVPQSDKNIHVDVNIIEAGRVIQPRTTIDLGK